MLPDTKDWEGISSILLCLVVMLLVWAMQVLESAVKEALMKAVIILSSCPPTCSLLTPHTAGGLSLQTGELPDKRLLSANLKTFDVALLRLLSSLLDMIAIALRLCLLGHAFNSAA